MDGILRFGSIFMTVGSGILFFAALWLLIRHLRFLIVGHSANAKVIDFKVGTFDEKPAYYPIVQFTDKDGIEVTQPLTTSSDPKKLNKMMDIIYLKKGDKYDAVQDDIFPLVILPILISIIPGLIFMFTLLSIVFNFNS